MTDMPHDDAPRPFGVADFFKAFRVQRGVWAALIMRELHTRYGRKGLGYAWLILEPLLLAVMVLLLKIAHERNYGGGVDIVPFIILGYVNFMMFRSIFNRGESALEANKTLLHHRMVSIFDILLSRSLLEAAGTWATIIIMISFTILLGLAEPPARPFELILGLLLLLWFSFSLSMVICAGTYENTTLQKFVHPVSYILLPLSGAFVMVKWVPENLQRWAVWWPMSNIFELIRYGQFESLNDRFADAGYVAICCMVLTVIGLLSLQLVRRKLTV